MKSFIKNKFRCSELIIDLAALNTLNSEFFKPRDLSETLKSEVQIILEWLDSLGSEAAQNLAWEILIDYET